MCLECQYIWYIVFVLMLFWPSNVKIRINHSRYIWLFGIKLTWLTKPLVGYYLTGCATNSCVTEVSATSSLPLHAMVAFSVLKLVADALHSFVYLYTFFCSCLIFIHLTIPNIFCKLYTNICADIQI